jgi:hypothetical protein
MYKKSFETKEKVIYGGWGLGIWQVKDKTRRKVLFYIFWGMGNMMY